MINTFFSSNSLSSTGALYAALLIGVFFGLVLERAGFGSSRRLAGVFYFTDMSVIKVMFTGLVTAMLGLIIADNVGMIDLPVQIYLMPTYYVAYIVAGLIFGVGFVMGGWCPGTAMVGVASGKIDALIFLTGGIIGSFFFNEIFFLVKSLMTLGQSNQDAYGQPGVAFIYNTLGVSRSGFALFVTLIAVAAALGCEWIESLRNKTDKKEEQTTQLKYRLIYPVLVTIAVVVWIIPETKTPTPGLYGRTSSGISDFLSAVDSAEDHVEPEEIADLLMRGETGIQLVDIRSAQEYNVFHIRGAVNVAMAALPDFAEKHKNERMVVLYSNGMTHPAQARDALAHSGYSNVYLMTDGLTGFVDRCLKPVSLRSEPLPPETSARINAWRDYFYASEPAAIAAETIEMPANLPGMVDTGWVFKQLARGGLRIIDCREQPDYNRGHIPGAYSISFESFRGVINGVPSMLETAAVITSKIIHLNISPDDLVVLVYGGDRIRDATLIGMALERIGHLNYAILDGGVNKWVAEDRPLSTDLPGNARSQYPVSDNPDTFSVDYRWMDSFRKQKNTVIIDVRPVDYFLGKKTDEARAGHIPGARNRDFSSDVDKTESFYIFKSPKELELAYAGMIPSKNTPVAVHCRTGHQGSQTYFVLKHLLGHKKHLLV